MRPTRGKILTFGLMVTGISMASTVNVGQSHTLAAQEISTNNSPIPVGPSFRVETEIFENDKVQPIDRHLVLFDSGVIYDFHLNNDRFATMFDPARGRVVLVDKRKLEQAVVSTGDLLEATAQLRAAVTQAGKADKFGLNAVVAPAIDAQAGDVSAFEISFGDTKYRTTTQPVSRPELARAYNHFATLASQLNLVQWPGSVAPPFARMTLGQHVADAGLLPLETVLEVRRENKMLKDRLKSQLLVVEQLSTLDRNRIAEFGKILANCKAVELNEFGK